MEIKKGNTHNNHSRNTIINGIRAGTWQLLWNFWSVVVAGGTVVILPWMNAAAYIEHPCPVVITFRFFFPDPPPPPPPVNRRWATENSARRRWCDGDGHIYTCARPLACAAHLLFPLPCNAHCSPYCEPYYDIPYHSSLLFMRFRARRYNIIDYTHTVRSYTTNAHCRRVNFSGKHPFRQR